MIPISEPNIGEEELKNIIEAVSSGWVSSKGFFVEEFENNFANFIGTNYGISTSSGTTALHLALASLGISKNDEIILPAFTFIATANAVNYCNAKPIFVDSNPEYWCIDPDRIEEKITKNTKVIIPVHLYGHPCDMDIIMDIAEDRNLYVIEDAAQAHGSEYKGKKVGNFGDISCFSFFGNKTMTTGEGGICITNNKELHERMLILRDHGMNPNKRYWHDHIGFNYRMTNLQAALGVAQLKKLDNFVEKKINNANLYNSKLKHLEESKQITLPPKMSWAKNTYWTYSILLKDKYKMNRDQLMNYLSDKGVDNRPLFNSIPTMPPYKNNEKFPICEKISLNGISLPSSTKLKNDDIYKISDIIKNI